MNVPAPHAPPPTRQSSPLAVISLVCGILTLMVGLPASLPAIITGHIARRQIRREPDRYEGDTLALIGLVLGYIGLAITLLVILVLAFFFYPRFL